MEVPGAEFGSEQQDEGMSPTPEIHSSLVSVGAGTFFKKQYQWLPLQGKVTKRALGPSEQDTNIPLSLSSFLLSTHPLTGFKFGQVPTGERACS